MRKKQGKRKRQIPDDVTISPAIVDVSKFRNCGDVFVDKIERIWYNKFEIQTKQTKGGFPMQRKTSKRKLIILLASVAVLLVLSAFFFARIPQRIAADQLNKASDLPYGFLASPDFTNENFRIVDGFGTTGYYDRKYAEETKEAEETGTSGEPGLSDDWLLRHGAVVWWTSSYPDAVVGSSKITRIVCADPAYRIFGCAAGDDIGTFSAALVRAGFKQSSTRRYTYTKCGIHITLIPDDTRTKVAYFSVQAESGNLFRVQY